MSSDEFFGRPISQDMEDIEFDLCEVCQRKSPSWLEVQYQDGLAVVRFTCPDCHQEYVNNKEVEAEGIARQIEGDEELAETTRPGWVDEFIKEGGSTIEAIETVPVTEIAEVNKDQVTQQTEELEGMPPSEIGFSEAPETFKQVEYNEEEEVLEQRQIANWAPKFIQEALFGPNPEGWLQENEGYDSDNLHLTLNTLGSFAGHDVSSVKLSAIQCLLGAYNRNRGLKEKIIDELNRYLKDSDDTIREFAHQAINQM